MATVLRMRKDLYRRRTTGTGHQKQTRKPRPRYPLQSTVPGEHRAITQGGGGLASCRSRPVAPPGGFPEQTSYFHAVYERYRQAIVL